MSIRRSWHRIRRVANRENINALASLAMVAIFFASTAQWSALRDQLTLAYPPQLKANHFHIWEKGHGEPFARTNVVPPCEANEFDAPFE